MDRMNDSEHTDDLQAQDHHRKEAFEHENAQMKDRPVYERPLDLEAVRAKLQSKTGKHYWRTLEELAGDPSFEELLQREFPRQAPSEWDESVDRRDFLKLMGASLALAGLSGCGRVPEQ